MGISDRPALYPQVFQAYFGHDSWKVREYFAFRGYFGYVSALFRAHFVKFSGKFRAYFGYISGLGRGYFGASGFIPVPWGVVDSATRLAILCLLNNNPYHGFPAHFGVFRYPHISTLQF